MLKDAPVFGLIEGTPKRVREKFLENREQLFIGADLVARPLTPEATAGTFTHLKRSSNLFLDVIVPLDYFADTGIAHTQEEAVSLIHHVIGMQFLTERSVLAQSGAFIVPSTDLTEQPQDNALHIKMILENVNPMARFLIPPEFRMGRLYLSPQPLENQKLAETAMEIFNDERIELIGTREERVPIREVLNWKFRRRLKQPHLRAVSLPILRYGYSSAAQIDFNKLVSNRTQLDQDLQLVWGQPIPDTVNGPLVVLGDAINAVFPNDIAGMIVQGSMPDGSLHVYSHYFRPGFGGQAYADHTFRHDQSSERGTRMRIEYLLPDRRQTPPSSLWMFLYPSPPEK